MKKYLVIAATAVFLGVGILSFAQNPQAAQPERKTVLAYKDELKLTDAQVGKVKAILGEFDESSKATYGKAAEVDGEARKLLESNGDINEIGNKIKDSFALQAQLVINEIVAGRKIDAVLTPEQAKQWKDIRIEEIKKAQEAMRQQPTMPVQAAK